MPKISVIIPVYNVEEYLEQCLDSIINQTFKDLEIICVNDGSTDKSLCILEKYAQKDNRIKIINQTNQGLSAARNTGIENATGEYISFVDSDDYIKNNLYETLLKYLPSELICFNAEAFGDFPIPDKLNKYLKYKYNGVKNITDKVIFNTNVYAWNKLFKTEIIQKYKIKFPEGLYFEDFVFLWDYMLKIKKVNYLRNNENFYFYRQRSTSIMNNCGAKSIHHLYAWHNLYTRLKNENILNKHKKWIIKLFEKYFYLAYKLSDDESKNEILRHAENLAEEIKYKHFLKLKNRIISNQNPDLSIFQQIFSIKNENNYKCLRVLGVKFKIQRIIKFDPKPRLLVHLHLYYHNQLEYMLQKLANINNCDWDLFVTVCEKNQNSIDKIKSLKPDAKIIKVDNKGYDIWPFLQVLNFVDLKNYDYILKIHTKNFRSKKAFSFGKGYSWRNILVDALLKSKSIFNSNLYKLIHNPDTGMLASQVVLSKMGDKCAEDNELFFQFCEKYKIPAQKGIFVSGTMFIARANCFEIIKQIKLSENDFSTQQYTNGTETISHTLERIFSRIIEMQNYKICGIKNKKYNFKQNIKKVLQFLFSLKNENIHGVKYKQVRILGVKTDIK